MSEALEEAIASVERMQTFDVGTLPRVEELGRDLSFTDAVEPATRLIELYKRISIGVLKDFPDEELVRIKKLADADYAILNRVLEFQVQGTPNPDQVKMEIVQQIHKRYHPTFTNLRDIISYSAIRTTDYKNIEHEARGVFQGIKDQAAAITRSLNQSKTDAENVLDEVRKVAAEQGVSQQAIYFREESEYHSQLAKNWLIGTIIAAIILGLVSIGFLFVHRWGWIDPSNKYEVIQLIASKVFIFATLTYLLYLCGKNYSGHKHNSILNKHRQNALMTFKAMTEAGESQQCKEIVIAQAAYCMFSPQDTGYIKVVPGDNSMKTFVESIPKTSVRVDG